MTSQEIALVSARLGELAKIGRQLHRICEADCNGETGANRREKREERLVKRAREIADEFWLQLHYQTDPRGWPLYLVPREWDREKVSSCYNQGFAVPWRR